MRPVRIRDGFVQRRRFDLDFDTLYRAHPEG